MLKKDTRTKIKPIDGKWSPEVFRKYDNDWLLRQTWDYEEEDYQMAYYALFEELAMRALEDQSILDDVIAAMGRHMRYFARISMGTPLARMGLEILLRQNDEGIRQTLINHANDWDAERQINFFRYFAPDTRTEEDRVLVEQINLLETQDKYGFKPKFGIRGVKHDWMPEGEEMVSFYDLEETNL